jgi:hypothetical protein
LLNEKVKHKYTIMWTMHSYIICTKESQGFKNFDVLHSDNRLKDMDLLLTCSWFNQNIKSRTILWPCFNYIKKGFFLIILNYKKNLIIFYGFAHLKLHPIHKRWCIAHKLDHLFSFPFIVTLFAFLFFIKLLWQQVIHPHVHLIQSIIQIERKL